MITDDKRAFKRVPCKINVKVLRTEKKGFPESRSVTENISLGGMYFTSLQKIEIGERIECRIKLPNGSNENKWLGRVVRCEKIEDGIAVTFGIATEFLKAFKSSENNLKRLLTVLENRN
ncbi:MAG: PilZ domain-containing protein [Candidatus Omnitrophota bacterium]